MNIKLSPKVLLNHPLGALYGTLLGFVVFFAAVPMFSSGMYDAALVDLVMAGILIAFMLKKFYSGVQHKPSRQEKVLAWVILIAADILAILPAQTFPGSLSTALAFALLICALVLFFSGRFMAMNALIPALWCCVFMPYHAELMLLLSYPLRLNATVVSTALLKMCNINVTAFGTSLELPGLDISITDACSGINQLDAFILIAFIAVQMMHRKTGWKLLHFAFIIPAIIAGNSLRIVLTVLLYRSWGETVLQGSWHTVLGYVQIIVALIIFLIAGKIFSSSGDKPAPEEAEV